MAAVLTPSAVRGFTLIELMTAIALFAILVVMAMPMYSAFIANSQIRTATESMQAGVRLAQTEAVKRNGNVEFVLDPAVGWKVNDVSDIDAVTEIQKSAFTDAASQTVVTPLAGLTRVTFNGLGRTCCDSPPKNPIDGSDPLAQVDVTTSVSIAQPRKLRLVIGSAYGIKVCDPALASTDPAGCP